MDEIRSWLYIGNYHDTLNKYRLELNSIQAMLQLAEEVKQDGIPSIYLPVEDLEPIPNHLIEQGIGFVHVQRKQNRRILVACGAGINRSTAFCIASLKEEEGINIFQAFQEIKQKHPEAMPHQPVWESLCEYYDENVPYTNLMSLKA